MKIFIYLISTILFLTITNCTTDIPETDTIPPTFLFKITGDGFERSFTQDDDFESFQLKLRTDTNYDFTFSAGDQGGMKQIQWQLPIDYLEFTTDIESPWTTREVSALDRVVQWIGDRDNPITGHVIVGKFKTDQNVQGISLGFKFYIVDFGGESAESNITFKELIIFIGDHQTEVVEF